VIPHFYYAIRRRYRRLFPYHAVTQPTPDVNEEDVIRVILRDFPSQQFDTVMPVLREYDTEKWEGARARVYLACLKLANGNVDKLREQTKRAKQDFRDVLAGAEYPGYCRAGMFRVRELPRREQQSIVDGDWKQYEEWLRR
jgi:hypothetical protein